MVPHAELFLFGYVQLLGCELELTSTKIGVFQRAGHFIHTSQEEKQVILAKRRQNILSL